MGFIDVPKPKNKYDPYDVMANINTLNIHLNSNKKHHSFGFHSSSSYISSSSINKIGSGTLPVSSQIMSGSKFKFKVDFKIKQVSIYYNDKFVGPLWKNIADCIVPAVSNNRRIAGYSISHTWCFRKHAFLKVNTNDGNLKVEYSWTKCDHCS